MTVACAVKPSTATLLFRTRIAALSGALVLAFAAPSAGEPNAAGAPDSPATGAPVVEPAQPDSTPPADPGPDGGPASGSPSDSGGDLGGPLPEIVLHPGDIPLFSLETPIGPIEYGLGRGLELGRTGLHIGGFTTLAFDREDGKAGELELDGVNFLVLLEPNEFIRGFMEIEVGDFLLWKTDENSAFSKPSAVFERLYGDLRIGDPFTLRIGKFQTPIGRWNLVSAEPFVWTPIDPAFVEIAFDEHQTGGAVLGSLRPGSGTLDYWVFGQFIDPLDPSEDPEHADYSVGGRVQYGRAVDQWSFGSSFMATEIGGAWSYLGGLDGEVRFDRVLLTSEFTVQQGSLQDRDLWDIYLQGVFELVPSVYLVGRYEHIDPSGSDEDAHLGDLGVTWIPKPYLIFKASYRVTDQQTELVRRGFNLSFSFIF